MPVHGYKVLCHGSIPGCGSYKYGVMGLVIHVSWVEVWKRDSFCNLDMKDWSQHFSFSQLCTRSRRHIWTLLAWGERRKNESTLISNICNFFKQWCHSHCYCYYLYVMSVCLWGATSLPGFSLFLPWSSNGLFPNTSSLKDGLQDIFMERKMSRALKILAEMGFGPKQSPSGVISNINSVFQIFHWRNLISEYEKLL